MTKFQQKQKLFANDPFCYRCRCKLKLVAGNIPPQMTNAAIILHVPHGDVLICYQCRNIEEKKKAFKALNFQQRFVRHLDRVTGIISWYDRTRKRINKYLYVHRGGKLNGKP